MKKKKEPPSLKKIKMKSFMVNFIHQPEGTIRLGDYLKMHLEQPGWTHFRAAVAFVKRSGVQHIQNSLAEFSKKASVKMSVGIDMGGTSLEGLNGLLASVKPPNQIWIYHNANQSTFHPKVYLFKNNKQADVLVGSGNLTEGGLFTNYEASFAITLNLSKKPDKAVLKYIEELLDSWSNLAQGTAQLLTPEFLEELVKNDYVPKEINAREIEERTARGEHGGRSSSVSLFKAVPVQKPPKKPLVATGVPGKRRTASVIGITQPIGAQQGKSAGFLMTLQKTDVGRGQITPGTSQRSPEIFIPLGARDFDPAFWGWPNAFTPDPAKRGKMDRRGVKMRIGADVVDVNMMTWPDKHDFRLRCEALRSAGNVEDILRIEQADGKNGFTYYVEIIPQGTMHYEQYLSLCQNSVKNSQKKWGYY